MRICIRPLHGAFVLLAIKDKRIRRCIRRDERDFAEGEFGTDRRSGNISVQLDAEGRGGGAAHAQSRSAVKQRTRRK